MSTFLPWSLIAGQTGNFMPPSPRVMVFGKAEKSHCVSPCFNRGWATLGAWLTAPPVAYAPNNFNGSRPWAMHWPVSSMTCRFIKKCVSSSTCCSSLTSNGRPLMRCKCFATASDKSTSSTDKASNRAWAYSGTGTKALRCVLGRPLSKAASLFFNKPGTSHCKRLRGKRLSWLEGTWMVTPSCSWLGSKW